MKASDLTMRSAKSYGTGAIRLACAMALDLATLSDIKAFPFKDYNESIAEDTSLDLKTIQNVMTVAKKIINVHQPKYAEFAAMGLNETSLAYALEFTHKDLAQSGYKTSLSELDARLSGKASPAAKARKAKQDAAAAITLAMQTPAPAQPETEAAPETEATPEADVVGAVLVQGEPEAQPEAAPEAAPEAQPEAAPETEAPAETVTADVLTAGAFSVTVSHDITVDEIMSMAEALMQLAMERATAPEAIAA